MPALGFSLNFRPIRFRLVSHGPHSLLGHGPDHTHFLLDTWLTVSLAPRFFPLAASPCVASADKKADIQNKARVANQTATHHCSLPCPLPPHLAASSSPLSLLPLASADKKADIQNKARLANQTATDLQAKTADGITIVNNGLRVLSITFYVIGCVITALCILALLFSLLKWVVASNVIITIIWVVVFFTWCMTAGLLIAYLVNGDTSVALEQVQQSPTMNSAMDKYLHCIPSEKLLNATRYARYTAATVLTTANSSVVSNAPRLFKFLGVPGGICVPYGPAPNFTRDTDLCVEGTILFPQFVNMLMTTAGNTMLVPEVVRNDLTATAQTLALLESTIPNVLTLVDCSYVANIAAFALSEAQAMVTNFRMLWVGFLVITIACMMQALSTPIYVFRAVRIGDKLSDAEVEG
ncbi:unnamed protein product, partial [Closterium sp. NIES-53]